jgi:hypothetical protein
MRSLLLVGVCVNRIGKEHSSCLLRLPIALRCGGPENKVLGHLAADHCIIGFHRYSTTIVAGTATHLSKRQRQGASPPKPPRLREPVRRQPTRLLAFADPVAQVELGPRLVAEAPGRPFRQPEHPLAPASPPSRSSTTSPPPGGRRLGEAQVPDDGSVNDLASLCRQ